jgi:MucR family transcriptional regulator, transcriptional regulator of exopolysaccharide biosynthesis
MQDKGNLVELTADIVAAYVGNNTVAQADLPKLIANIYQSLAGATHGAGEAKPPDAVELKPAVPVRKSITPDYIICLEDGKKFKSLKRHLRTHYDLSPEQYREKWGLPHDYPMVAPTYAEARSSLAKKIGLGQNRR